MRTSDTLSLGLILLILLVFFQVRHHQFIRFDDNIYVAENPHISEGLTRESIRWAFEADLTKDSRHADYWQPVTFIFRMLDMQIFGQNPGGHHLMNVWFHIINTLLVFSLLRQLTGSIYQSAFAAAIFAVHPLQVEPVAWVTARKDLLSAFFGLLTLQQYAAFVKKPSAVRYTAAIFFFSLGLMSKPMLITLPVLILILDFWPLERRASIKILLEKIPFFLLSAASATLTLAHHASYVQHVSPTFAIWNIPFAYMHYLSNIFYPRHLAIRSSQFESTEPLWQITLSGIILIMITLRAIRAGREKRYFAAGWFWFLFALGPTIILNPSSDRFMYLPIVGPAVIVAWGIPDFLNKTRPKKKILPIGAAIVIAALAMYSRKQVSYWKDSLTFFDYCVRVTKNNFLIEHNLAVILHEHGRVDEAIAHYTNVLNMDVNEIIPRINLANALTYSGRTDEAIGHYRKAIEINPNFSADIYSNLGVALMRQEKFEEAEENYRHALEMAPHSTGALNNFGDLRARQNQFEDAIVKYREAIKINPDYAEAYNNLGIALLKQEKLDEARIEFAHAMRINPKLGDAHYNLGLVMARSGNTEEAERRISEALRLKPELAELTEPAETDTIVSDFSEASITS